MEDSGTACMGLFEPGQPLLFTCGGRKCLQEAQRELAPFAGGEDRANSPSEPVLMRVLGTVNGISGLASLSSLGYSGLVPLPTSSCLAGPWRAWVEPALPSQSSSFFPWGEEVALGY